MGQAAAVETSVARVGVLAVQGGFQAHCAALRELGAEPVEVRGAGDVEGLDGLILPGGESTTIAMGIESQGLGAAITSHHGAGRPILATCAGMILVSRNHLGLVDCSARRNAFGRQLASFEADLEMPALGPEPLRAVFIRAPWAEDLGEEVEVLARWQGHPVALSQGPVTACSFHPELTPDRRLHRLLLDATDRQ